MQTLHLTLGTPPENVALDEALLEWAEERQPMGEFLRIWESPRPLVVVGRSSHVAAEVNEIACGADGIAIVRRSSGGAAVVAGPGCLMYAVVLSFAKRPELRDIGRAHAFILDRLQGSIGALVSESCELARAGTSDLTIRERDERSEARKFSGNSLRVKRTHLLYHGTLLYDFDLALVERYLRMPPRTPDYRAARSHGDFVANLPVGREKLVDAVTSAWPTTGEATNFPLKCVEDLVASRFGQRQWNFELP